LRNTNWQPNQDPKATREAGKYDQPIASREHLLHLLTERNTSLSLEEIATELGLTDKNKRTALKRRLRAMQRDGQITKNRQQKYELINKSHLVHGRVVAHPNGFGFLLLDNGEKVHLSTREMQTVLHNDRIVVSITGIDRRGRKQGRLVEVLERNTSQVIGRLVTKHKISFIIPDDNRIHQDILIPPDQIGAATEGQIVVADIIAQPNDHSQPIGRVVEVLGKHMAPGMETDIAIHKYGLPAEWPKAVIQEAVRFGSEVLERDTRDRIDLRDYPLVTIDGPDAQDFDDAVCCRRTPNGWKLLVAIADASAYVAPGTALDDEARLRGNSVYFSGRTIPMLPESLSNGLCSLNPQVDRLCLACEILIDKQGKTIRTRFMEGVMRSQARLTYDEMAAIVVTRDVDIRRKYQPLLPHLDELYRLYQALQRAREERGAIEFDRTETKIVLDSEQKIQHIKPLLRNDAHRLIEECMIAANVAAARFLQRRKMPALYRIHDSPTVAKLEDMRTFLRGLGLRLRGGEHPRPGDYAHLLKQVAHRPEAHLIQTVLLRSLAQAVYNRKNIGHFGLSHDCYTHFTSPIRRYPDLFVHRAIRHLIKNGNRSGFGTDTEDLEELGIHSSFTERRADEATRDVTERLKCEYMVDKVGEIFPGIITAVTSFGLFVEPKDIYVEGLVHVTALDDDYYHFDAVHHRLQGERTRRTYRLADAITVRVVRVDPDQRKIDFELA